jgi:uncharacterized protein YbcV (DUF1398 family)
MNPSLSQSIRAVWTQVHSSTSLDFPTTVSTLLALGVSRYHIDYAAKTATAYVPDAQTGKTDVDRADIPAINASPGAWSKQGLVDAIRWVQSGSPDYSYTAFARKCVEAGVTEYHAYLQGQKVVYLGELGDVHVEWFPGAGPKDV